MYFFCYFGSMYPVNILFNSVHCCAGMSVLCNCGLLLIMWRDHSSSASALGGFEMGTLLTSRAGSVSESVDHHAAFKYMQAGSFNSGMPTPQQDGLGGRSKDLSPALGATSRDRLLQPVAANEEWLHGLPTWKVC